MVAPKRGRWFRFDLETSAYYYYEAVVDAYVEVGIMTIHRRPLEVPMGQESTDPNDIPGEDDDPPPPAEP